MTPSEHLHNGAETATDLLARRAQLQAWLARLGEVSADIPTQVSRRVREDYEQRLASVVDELSAHSEALAADRQRLDEKLLAAAERHDAATDALEEVRLRHLIGELADEDWENRRPALESEVEAAAGERADTEREIAALDDLFQQIAGTPGDDAVAVEALTVAPVAATELDAAAAPAPHEDVPAAESFADAADAWDPDLPLLEEPQEPRVSAGEESRANGGEPLQVGAYAPDAAPSAEAWRVDDDLVEITNFAAEAEALADEAEGEPADEDYAFLEELDRAIAATAPTEGAAPDPDEPATETRPQPGLKCPECGYSNDPAAWYCGVCGVDLG